MFRIEHISYTYMAVILACVLMLFFHFSWMYSEKIMKKMGNILIIQSMIKAFSRKHFLLKALLFTCGTFFLFIALANPQFGSEKEKVKAKGADIFIIFDISTSMLAEDVPPNRLERAKRQAIDLVQKLKGNRIALIYFAGGAYLQMPLTLDYGAASMLLQAANVNQVGTQGTSLAEAFSVAERAELNDDNAQNVMIVISDVESHDDDALSKAKDLQSKGWIIHVVGVGTEAGAFIPSESLGLQGYKKDENGELVKTKLNTVLMNSLAQVGNGISVNITDNNAMQNITDEVNKIQTGEISTYDIKNFRSLFQYFLFLSLLCFGGFLFLNVNTKK